MTIFGHVLDIEKTVAELDQNNYDTIDMVVDTIIRTTGGSRSTAIRFIHENPIFTKMSDAGVNEQQQPCLPNRFASYIRAYQAIIEACVVARIAV